MDLSSIRCDRRLNRLVIGIVIIQFGFGCAMHPFNAPYAGVNPDNPQFERGHPSVILDGFGDLISKPYQLLFWTRKYGNHRVSKETEAAASEFLSAYGIKAVKVRINQWAPHKEIIRLIKNKQIRWPFKIIFFPSTLIASLIARPTSGFLISDYYDPGSNTINIFSDEICIGLHESGHAKDFASRRWKGLYGILRYLPGIDIVEEAIASDEAFAYLEATGNTKELVRAYKILYPAFGTYISQWIPIPFFGLLGGLGLGHVIGRTKAHNKEKELRELGKIPWLR